MNLTTSPPVQLVLTATIVGSAVVMLRPDPVERPVLPSVKSESHRALEHTVPSPGHESDPPWKRGELPEPAQPKNASPETMTAPPLPTQVGVASDAEAAPPLPPPPSGQAQQDIVYLGRMIKDDKVQVFLATHGEPFAVSQGDVLNSSWLVQSVSPASVTLRHLQSGKILVIATEHSPVPDSTDVKAVQIGPRFLASDPTQHQPKN